MNQPFEFEKAVSEIANVVEDNTDINKFLTIIEELYNTAFKDGVMDLIASNIEARITGGNSYKEIYDNNLEFFEKNGGKPEGYNRTHYNLKRK